LNEKNKKIAKLLVRILITILLLTWVFTKIDFQQFADIAKKARWYFLILSWILTLFSFWVMSFTMRLIMKRLDCEVGTGTVFFASAITSLYGMILPGILDVSAKWYILKLHTGKPSHILSGMVYNQFTSTLMIIIFGLSALIISNPTADFKLPLICIFLLIITISCSLLLFNQITGLKVTVFLGSTLKWLPSRLNEIGRKILDQLSTFQIAEWRFHLQILSLTAFTTFLGVILYVFAAKAAGITVSFGVLAWQSSLIYLLGRLPISIADLGVREITIVESLAQYGVSAPEALLMSMVVFSNRIIMVLLGAIYQIWWVFRGHKLIQAEKH
jgi:uncharacterized membrane protein YbhN (UPF0104 family)